MFELGIIYNIFYRFAAITIKTEKMSFGLLAFYEANENQYELTFKQNFYAFLGFWDREYLVEFCILYFIRFEVKRKGALDLF